MSELDYKQKKAVYIAIFNAIYGCGIGLMPERRIARREYRIAMKRIRNVNKDHLEDNYVRRGARI